MRLSRTTAYAIQAALHLARAAPGTPVSCRELARMGQMPERFLLQILRSLVNRGLLRSTRGVDGGYFLARAPQQISLYDIIEAFDSSLEAIVPMLDGLRTGVHEKLWATLQNASRLARAELRKVTLADLLLGDEPSNARPISFPAAHVDVNPSRR